MANHRLSSLIALQRQDPGDPFLRYAIGLEYLKNDPQRALEYFDRLLAEQPDYLPVYYQAGALLAELGQRERADGVYRRGIEEAKKQGEQKTLHELKGAYQSFLTGD